MGTVEDIKKFIKSNNSALIEKITNDIKAEINTNLSAKIDSFAVKFSDQIKTIESTTTRMQEKIEQLEDKIARISKMCSLVIRNIPLVTDEQLCDIFNAICNKIGFNIPVPYPQIFRTKSTKETNDNVFEKLPAPHVSAKSSQSTVPEQGNM